MFLVIGYGNELRRDDGLGPRAARAVAEWGLPGMRALAVHQLTPELADEIGRADAVLFVDAGCDPSAGVQVRPVESMIADTSSFHTSSPGSLLALAGAVWGRRPAAWLLTIPGRDFDFGEELSPEAGANLDRALDAIRRKIEETACTRSA